MTISVTLQYFTWRAIWHVNSRVKIHSLSQSHVWTLAVSLNCEKKSWPQSKRKFWRGLLYNCFPSGWKTLCRSSSSSPRLNTSTKQKLPKMPRNEAKIYQELVASWRWLFHWTYRLDLLLSGAALCLWTLAKTLFFRKSTILAPFIFKIKMWQVLKTSCWILLRALLRSIDETDEILNFTFSTGILSCRRDGLRRISGIFQF